MSITEWNGLDSPMPAPPRGEWSSLLARVRQCFASARGLTSMVGWLTDSERDTSSIHYPRLQAAATAAQTTHSQPSDKIR